MARGKFKPGTAPNGADTVPSLQLDMDQACLFSKRTPPYWEAVEALPSLPFTHRCLQTLIQSSTCPSEFFPTGCVSLGCQYPTLSNPPSLLGAKGLPLTYPSSSYLTSSPGWLRCSRYARDVAVKGGPPDLKGFFVGNSRQIRLARDE
jgi:hypothetical protein